MARAPASTDGRSDSLPFLSSVILGLVPRIHRAIGPRSIGGAPVKQYFVYIVASKRRGTLYIGVTNNIVRRAMEHRDGAVPGFTKTYAVKQLVYYEVFQEALLAIQREKSLKRWPRDWKLNLVERLNPTWDDLLPALLGEISINHRRHG